MNAINEMNNKIKNRTIDMDLHYTCTDCGKDVTVKLGEILFLHDKGLRISTRCKECRDKKNERFKHEAENCDKEG